MLVITGIARLGRRTKELAIRLKAGDIAVIDHEGIDGVAAWSLVARGARAVLNAAPCFSSQYPNTGPQVFLQCGLPVWHSCGAAVFDLHDGERIKICAGRVYRAGDERVLAQGELLTQEQMAKHQIKTMAALGRQLNIFVDNTLAFVQREKSLLVDDLALPPLKTKLAGKHVLVIARGPGYRTDLFAIRGYMDAMQPVLIGVDGGADALLELGYKPDMIIGDMDSVTDAALRQARDLIVHAYVDGRAPGAARLQALGLGFGLVRSLGTSEDVALLAAHQLAADLIVGVGLHSNMIDFLEKGRPGMASTLLVRMRVGPKLVDAKGVSRLWEGRLRARQFLPLVAAAMLPITIVMCVAPWSRLILRLLWMKCRLVFGY